jgi:hypothetical protein
MAAMGGISQVSPSEGQLQRVIDRGCMFKGCFQDLAYFVWTQLGVKNNVQTKQYCC